jgi:hypothetical protein
MTTRRSHPRSKPKKGHAVQGPLRPTPPIPPDVRVAQMRAVQRWCDEEASP